MSDPATSPLPAFPTYYPPLPADHPPVPAHSHTRGCPFSAKHEYCPPQVGDIRSPCPALNTMANHGYINRSGKNLTANALVRGLRACYNLSLPLAIVLSYGGFLLLHKYNLFQKITLHDVGRHNRVEHDASLVHRNTPDGEEYAPIEVVMEWVEELVRDARGGEEGEEEEEEEGMREREIGQMLGQAPSSALPSPTPTNKNSKASTPVTGMKINLPTPTSTPPKIEPSPSGNGVEITIPPSHTHFRDPTSSTVSTAVSSLFSHHSRFSSTSTAATTPTSSPSPTFSKFRFGGKSIRGLGQVRASGNGSRNGNGNGESGNEGGSEASESEESSSSNSSPEHSRGSSQDDYVNSKDQVVVNLQGEEEGEGRVINDDSKEIVLSPVSEEAPQLPSTSKTTTSSSSTTSTSLSKSPYAPTSPPPKSRILLSASDVARARVRRENALLKEKGRVMDGLHAEIARGEMAIVLGMWNVDVEVDEEGRWVGGEDVEEDVKVKDVMFPGEGNVLGGLKEEEKRGLKRLLSIFKSPSPSSSSIKTTTKTNSGIPIEWIREWIAYERLPGGWRADHTQGLIGTVRKSREVRKGMERLRMEEEVERGREGGEFGVRKFEGEGVGVGEA